QDPYHRRGRCRAGTSAGPRCRCDRRRLRGRAAPGRAPGGDGGPRPAAEADDCHGWPGPASPPRRSSPDEPSQDKEALRTGWINAVLPTDDFTRHALAWAAAIGQNPGPALNAAKKSVVFGARLPFADALKRERQLFTHLTATSQTLNPA